ncbi:hypothetical protein WJX82_002059 [Trebouxia sp. C0006]
MINTVPEEVLYQITSKLPATDLAHLRLTCRRVTSVRSPVTVQRLPGNAVGRRPGQQQERLPRRKADAQLPYARVALLSNNRGTWST